MCARRFLTIIFVLTLLVVAGAFAIYQWGGNVLLKQAVPKGHFEAAEAGGGPDYSADGSWLSRPGLSQPDDPAQWTPAGTDPVATLAPRPRDPPSGKAALAPATADARSPRAHGASAIRAGSCRMHATAATTVAVARCGDSRPSAPARLPRSASPPSWPESARACPDRSCS